MTVIIRIPEKLNRRNCWFFLMLNFIIIIFFLLLSIRLQFFCIELLGRLLGYDRHELKSLSPCNRVCDSCQRGFSLVYFNSFLLLFILNDVGSTSIIKQFIVQILITIQLQVSKNLHSFCRSTKISCKQFQVSVSFSIRFLLSKIILQVGQVIYLCLSTLLTSNR